MVSTNANPPSSCPGSNRTDLIGIPKEANHRPSGECTQHCQQLFFVKAEGKLLIHTGPKRRRLPVVIVVREARESRQAAVVSLPLTFFLLPLLFPSADLVVQLGLPVYLMRRLPVEQTNGSEAEKGSPSTVRSAAVPAQANNCGGHRWCQALILRLPSCLCSRLSGLT